MFPDGRLRAVIVRPILLSYTGLLGDILPLVVDSDG